MQPKTELDAWVEITRAWLDEQMAEQRARDEAAFGVFMTNLLKEESNEGNR